MRVSVEASFSFYFVLGFFIYFDQSTPPPSLFFGSKKNPATSRKREVNCIELNLFIGIILAPSTEGQTESLAHILEQV